MTLLVKRARWPERREAWRAESAAPDIMRARWPERREALRRMSGFTLFELLVVLAIMALVAGLLPQATAVVPGFRFRAAVRELAAGLRLAQTRAVLGGEPVAILLDPGARHWQASGEAPRHLPAAIERLEVEIAGLAEDAGTRLLFLPDGSARAATLRLAGGGRQAVLRIAWIGGRVSFDE
jgi:general secretion pathway protein H